jgi:PAS domain S-box-containing protein
VTQTASEPVRSGGLGWAALPLRARAYVGAIIAAGALVAAFALSTASANPILFAILLACSCLTSAWKVNLPLPMSNGCTLSMSYAADLMALILLGPAPATIVAVAGAWTQCTLKVKQAYPWYRTAFSMAAEALTMTATAAAYLGLGGPMVNLAEVSRAVVGAIATYFVVNSGIVAVAIGWSTRRSVWRVWHDDFLWSVPSFLVAGTAGAGAALVIQRGGQWLAILALAPVYLTYRTYQIFLRRIDDERRHAIETERLHTEAVEALMHAKQAEQALAHEKERLAVTLRSVGDGVIATDLEGRVLLINNAAEALTGWTQEAARGQRLPDVFQTFEPETRRRCDNSIDALGRPLGQPRLCRSTVLVARDFSERPIEEIAAPLCDDLGRTVGMVVTFRDITQALHMREERDKAQRVAMLGLLAGGIAHDFNNILMAVTGNLSLARASVTPGSLPASSLAEAEEACLRARQLTWRLLTFSKGGVPVKKTVALGPVLNEAARLATRGTNVTCRLTIAADLWPVSADESQLVQVFTNIVLNAQQAMPSGGIVDVTAENAIESIEHWQYALRAEPGAYVRVSIADRGIGIPEENIGRIFDPYFTTKQVGSGLGLATTYTMVKNHGGHFAVRSAPGEGTTVTVNLPATAAAAQSAVREPDRRLRPASRSTRGRILVMDDEQSIRTLTVNMLTFLGYEAEATSDGSLAIERYRRAFDGGIPFAAVILDLIVPHGVGGREALQQLKSIDPSVSGIIVSGYAQDPVITDYREHGFKAVIAKPFTLQELRWTVDSVVPSRRTTVH